MKKEVTKARNLFNCEAFHLEHITNMDEVKQLLKYELMDLHAMVSSPEDFGFNMGIDKITPPLSKEEVECGCRLYHEAKEVCECNHIEICAVQCFLIIALFGGRKFDCDHFSLQHITTMDEVKQFADYLKDLQLYVTKEKPFEDYLVKYANEPMFTKEDAEIANRLMKECIEVCEANHEDVYHVMSAARNKDHFIAC
jgi:hypothetical protein